MEGTPQPPWSIYKEQLDFLFLGHALWEPAPTSNYTRITIGDVGFIRRGQFHLLFSAAPPLGERERGVDVPATFEQLNVGNLASTQPRQPGCLRTSTVREVEADFGATASITRPLAPGASFSYELTENRGAALVTKYRTYRVDALFESAFKKYTKRHYKSWVAFARDRQYGEDVQPVLVSGFDMTKDFAMVAYSDDRPSSGANFTITVSSLGSASNSIWGTWRTACSPHTNCGPDENDPLLRERAIESPSPHSVQAGTIPNGFDQCAFVRYFTMRLRKRFALFPKVIRAGAGPHDLSPGNNGGGTFPESTVALDDDFATSGDDLKGQWCTSTGADDSKPDIVVHNAEYGDGYDTWDVIADYIFQNSNATSALMHHCDFVGIRTAGGADDLPTLLAMHRPRIVVDESGVGGIDRQEIQRPEAIAEGSNTPTLMYPRSTKAPAVSTKAKASLIGSLTTLTAQLDSLSADQDPEYLSRALMFAFTEPELYKMCISFLAEDEVRVKVLLEVFDKALTAPQGNTKIFKKLRQLCGRAGLLPASHIIPGSLIKTSEHPVALGTFGNVWEGIYEGNQVAIKALNVYDVLKVRKVFCKEVAGWRRISHPNIVPFLGVSEAPAPISMVSEWMPNGDVRSYVIKNPEVSRLQLLLDISRGLSFLHSLEIVHGDLKGANILVDKSGRARINDFGLTIIASLNCTETSASSGGTYRWMAPELLGLEQNPNKRCLPTPQSDAFALGMVAIEVFTGQVPFPELTRPFAVTIKLVDGERPPRPPKASRLGLSNELWAAVQSLWAHEPGDRPPLITFVDLLKRFNPDMGLLEELKEFDANSDKHIEKLNNILHYGDNALFGMREDESLVLIELFDRVLNSSLVDENIRGRCLRGLQKVSARCGLLPKSYWIAHDSLAQSDEALSATGRISDTCKRSLNGKLVAVKMINPDCVGSCGTFRQRLRTNAVMWKQLRHPNVVNFLGLVSDSPLSSLVYPWMPNGTLSEYLRKHPDVDKLSLLWDVARGLVYLHQDNLVHGNLTGNNILMDTNGVACLSEYGLELVLREEASSRSTLANVRWMAPEVLSAENKSKLFTVEDVKRADVYSLAMVMFEILTGTAPLEDASDEVVLKEVITGLRPEWPSDDPSQALIDALRNQVEACWCYDPEERPTALMALQSLQAFAQERDKERLQETQHLLEQGDDDSWDYLDDAAEVASKTHKGRREYLHLHLSGSTLVHESINRIREVFPHHGDSSTSSRDPTQGRRAKVKKGVRHLLHLAKPGLTTPEVVETRKPETEIVDRREETVQISDGSVSYLTSQPIPSGKKVKKVVITVDSKDQGWSSSPDDHGTYNNSWTWFELSVGPPSDGSVERWRGEVVRNLHAHGEFKEHTIEIFDKGLYEKAKGGDVLTVSAHARYPGWKNTVKKVKIRCVVV